MSTIKCANDARSQLRKLVLASRTLEHPGHEQLWHMNQINGYPTCAIARLRQTEMELLTGVTHLVLPMDRPFRSWWGVYSRGAVTAESIAREAADEGGRNNAILINRAFREVHGSRDWSASGGIAALELAIQRARIKRIHRRAPCHGLPYALQVEAEISKAFDSKTVDGQVR